MEKIPKEIENLTTDLEDMMETAEAVQGEAFADLACFVMNSRNLAELIGVAVEWSLEKNKNILLEKNGRLAEAITTLLSTSTNAYARAIGISEEKIQEAMKFIDVMNDKIETTKQKIRSSE
jgi:hypothetical protein